MDGQQASHHLLVFGASGAIGVCYLQRRKAVWVARHRRGTSLVEAA